MQLGEKIYTLRTRAGYSQENFAEALGVSRQSVSRWENDTAMPDTEYLVKMCRLLGTSLDGLMLEEDLPYTEEKPPMSAEEVQKRISLEKFSLIGFILSFFVCVAGLVISAVAVARGRRAEEIPLRAVAGTAIGAAGSFFLLIALVLIVVFSVVAGQGGAV